MDNIICVYNQAELDAVPTDYRGMLELRGECFELSRNMYSEIHAYGEAKISLRGKASMYVHNYCMVDAYDNAYVSADGHSIVRCHDESSCMLADRSTGHMFDKSSVYGVENCHAYLHDSSMGSFYMSCTVYAHGKSRVYAENFRGTIVAWDMSSVRGNNATGIDLRGHSRGSFENRCRANCWDRSLAVVSDSFVRLKDKARASLKGCSECEKFDDAVVVNKE